MARAVSAATSSPTPKKAAISSMDSSSQNVLSTSKQPASAVRPAWRPSLEGGELGRAADGPSGGAEGSWSRARRAGVSERGGGGCDARAPEGFVFFLRGGSSSPAAAALISPLPIGFLLLLLTLEEVGRVRRRSERGGGEQGVARRDGEEAAVPCGPVRISRRGVGRVTVSRARAVQERETKAVESGFERKGSKD